LIERHPWQAALLSAVRDDPRGLVELLRPLRWCEDTFREARGRLLADDYGGDIELAALTYTWRKMSRGGEGDVFSRCDDRDTQAWWDNGVAQLPAIAERLRGVTILKGDSMDLLATFDRPDALFYLDPPYVHSGRGNHRMYKRCEMDDRDHRRLCRVVKRLEGRVVLSGYDNAIYEEELGGWRKVSKEVFLCARFNRNAARRPKKTECLWLNY
jgi:site-specific DNA-adenine methylase